MSFERIKSGIPSLDTLLDNIRLGDNVVIQVTRLEEFVILSRALVKQAVLDKRQVNYIRFAEHEPILMPQDGLKIHTLNPGAGFELFTVNLHEIIEKEGVGAFYVFDSLSDLQESWSTDLMMGNFFCVTCPYLYELDTVAYFPVLRGYHDYATIARIQETTQILIDIYSNDKEVYLHPVKVWNRYSTQMYLPYKLNGSGEFEVLTDSVDLAGYYTAIHREQSAYSEQHIDSYELFFKRVREAYYSSGSISSWMTSKIIRSMMTHDQKIAAMIRKEFTPEDYFFIKTRMIGTGIIGGKACGMLLARKLIEKYLPECARHIEPHDSFYIGTDVFYSYIVENKLWNLFIRQRRPENFFEYGEKLSKALSEGKFPQYIREQFRRMLEYFGQIPIIVRSSSFLEDGFGNAFAGKYESVFCPNGGSPEERLAAFEDAVRRVYSSTMDSSALEYRRKRGVDRAIEQMAILVQRVSATKFGDYYMPCAAGVGFSHSVYRWSSELGEDAGFLRLVAGLGTRAVNRTNDDYPRLVNLDKPESSVLVNEEERHRFSQRYLDVINTAANKLEEVRAYDIIPALPSWYTNIICERDFTAESMLRERGESRTIRFISCRGLVRNKEIMMVLKDMLSTLQEHYGMPVDIEYTINFNREGAFTLNLVQCRPLSVWQASAGMSIPDMDKDRILFRINRTFMGNKAKIGIDAVVYIDARGYHEMPYNQKSIIVGTIRRINQFYNNSGKCLMLISPGRIGTSSPELGVAVSFSDISNFTVICEYEDAAIGFMPELSFGSHMFQDIVEAEMFYVAIMSRQDNIFSKGYLAGKESVLNRILKDTAAVNIIPGKGSFTDKEAQSMQAEAGEKETPPTGAGIFDIIRLYEIGADEPLNLYADFINKTVICGHV